MSNEVVILIPSYRPDQKLVTTIKAIRELSQQPIVIVDDGNLKREEQNLLLGLSHMPNIHLVHHAENRGKGAALKSGFQYILSHFSQAIGVVTADSDGQHAPKDILKIVQQLIQAPNHLVLGMRNFSGKDVPLRSRFGNQVTAAVFRFSTGISCPDTQTGLRGLPKQEMQLALSVKGERFEYEMNYLLDSAKRKVVFHPVSIATIYIEENISSHYNPVNDSLKILSAIFKFLLSSSIGTVIDLSLFFLLAGWIFPSSVTGIMTATILARIVSGLVNYWINVKWVFASQVNQGTFLRYILLFLGMMANSAILMAGISQILGYHFILKILIDCLLFLFSYKLQHSFVFNPLVKKTKNGHRATEKMNQRLVQS